MLMNEVASAADTLELWKLINDSVWSSLQKLQKAEEERKAAQKRAAARRVPAKRGVQYRLAAPTKPNQPVQQQQSATTSAVQAPQQQQMPRVATVTAQAPLRYGFEPQQAMQKRPVKPA